jgi:hypothetical protein
MAGMAGAILDPPFEPSLHPVWNVFADRVYGYTRIDVLNSTHLHFTYRHNEVCQPTCFCLAVLKCPQDDAVADEFWITK